MPFKLTQLASDSEFAELARVERIAYETPLCKLINLFFPLRDDSAAAREAAIQDAVQRQILWLHSDPSSKWIKVTDEESGKLAGAALWHFYDADPYAAPAEDECDWFTPGEDRDAANALMGQFVAPRMAFMRKPHAFLEICFTHPEFRRRGVGTMLMEWGMAEVKKRGVEAYIDATDQGRPLYAKYGFVAGAPREFTLKDLPASSRRGELEERLLPFTWWPMLRSVDGKSEMVDNKLA